MTRAPRAGARSGWAVALVFGAAACSGPSSSELRGDQRALTRVLAADAHTAELADPLIGRLGTGRQSAETAAQFDGLIRDAAQRALRLARETRVRTPAGRSLHRKLVAALGERVRLVDLFVRAARSDHPGDVLDAVTAARELEERLAEIDEQLSALSKRSH